MKLAVLRATMHVPAGGLRFSTQRLKRCAAAPCQLSRPRKLRRLYCAEGGVAQLRQNANRGFAQLGQDTALLNSTEQDEEFSEWPLQTHFEESSLKKVETQPSSTKPKLVRTPSSQEFTNINVCGIAGAPLGYGQPKAGTETAPQMLREAGLIGRLQDIGWCVEDIGDLDLPTHQRTKSAEEHWKAYDIVGQANKIIAEHVHDTLKRGQFALTIGGDHSIAFGTVSGALKANPDTRVIWVDAHADINTPQTSISGNLHGMPNSFLTRIEDPGQHPDMAWMLDYPQLQPDRLFYIGLRALDEGEKRIIKEYDIPAFTMFNVDHLGIGRVMEMVLELVGDNPIHLSFDIDGCDPFFAPSTGTPYGGGLTLREAVFLSEAVASTCQLTSMDLVEVNPRVDPGFGGSERTIQFAKDIIATSMGETIL